MRRYAADACTALGWAGSADIVALLVSEMTTDAVVRSGPDRVRVRVLDRGLRLRVEVSALGAAVPPGASPDREQGQGLPVVEAFAVAQGVDVRPDGRTDWFELGV